PLDVRATHEYIRAHWPGDQPLIAASLREIVSDAIREHFPLDTQTEAQAILDDAFRDSPQQVVRPIVSREAAPVWLKVSTHRVLDLFLEPLARSAGWKRLFLISPWISDIAHSASLTSDQLLKRLRDDGATAYVVTRPPENDWHERALTRIGETGRAN